MTELKFELRENHFLFMKTIIISNKRKSFNNKMASFLTNMIQSRGVKCSLHVGPNGFNYILYPFVSSLGILELCNNLQ